MLDIKFIRENPEKVKKGVRAKQLDSKLVDEALKLDRERRDLLNEIENFRASKNLVSDINNLGQEAVEKALKISKQQVSITEEAVEKALEISKQKPNLDQKIIEQAISIATSSNNTLAEIEPRLREAEEKLEDVLSQIPNLPADDVPIGKDENENEVLRKVGRPKKFGFKVRDHLELGEALDIIDVKRAAKVSGTRFGYLKGDAVLLELALINFAMEELGKKGFKPVVPPVLVKVPVFHNLGYSEHMGNEDYYVVHGGDPEKSKGEEEAEYYLVGTSEHSVVPMHKDEVLKAKDLPIRYVSFSSCFRREAGSYGKDTKGMLRVHQFDKVEMVSFTKPEEGDKEHEYLLSLEEKFLQALEIPYQVVKMCTGDLSAPAVRTYDLEAWMPGQNKYREITSASNTTDFQARRLNIKYQDKGKTGYVHTLNGTAFAIGRTIIAILENYQQKDGSVLVPKVLQKWVGKEKII